MNINCKVKHFLGISDKILIYYKKSLRDLKNLLLLKKKLFIVNYIILPTPTFIPRFTTFPLLKFGWGQPTYGIVSQLREGGKAMKKSVVLMVLVAMFIGVANGYSQSNKSKWTVTHIGPNTYSWNTYLNGEWISGTYTWEYTMKSMHDDAGGYHAKYEINYVALGTGLTTGYTYSGSDSFRDGYRILSGGPQSNYTSHWRVQILCEDTGEILVAWSGVCHWTYNANGELTVSWYH